MLLLMVVLTAASASIRSKNSTGSSIGSKSYGYFFGCFNCASTISGSKGTNPVLVKAPWIILSLLVFSRARRIYSIYSRFDTPQPVPIEVNSSTSRE